MSIDEMKAKAKKDKKIIFLVTDGNDNTSAITIERLIEKVRESEILVYTIALLNEEDRGEAKKARRALSALAGASGGMVYYPKDLVDVEKLALSVAHEIRNQYVLAYSPTNSVLDGSFRQIHVTVDGPGRPIARHPERLLRHPRKPGPRRPRVPRPRSKRGLDRDSKWRRGTPRLRCASKITGSAVHISAARARFGLYTIRQKSFGREFRVPRSKAGFMTPFRSIRFRHVMGAVPLSLALCSIPSAQAAPAASTDSRADAYYNYAMGHLYAELAGAFGNRSEYVNKAIDQLKQASGGPRLRLPSDELSDLYLSRARSSCSHRSAGPAHARPYDLDARRCWPHLHALDRDVRAKSITRTCPAATSSLKRSAKGPQGLDCWRCWAVSTRSPEFARHEKAYKKFWTGVRRMRNALTGLDMGHSDSATPSRPARVCAG
jgi:hypothetical protein